MIKNKIYAMDCIEFMSSLNEKVDLILTSPPYNMTERPGGDADSGRYDVYEDWKSIEEYLNWSTAIFNGFNKILQPNGVILYNFSYSIENPTLPYFLVNHLSNTTSFSLADTIIWKKPNSMPYPANPNRLQRIWEFIFVFVRKHEMDNFITNKQISKIAKTGQKYYKPIYNFFEAKNNDKSTKEINQATFSTDMVLNLLNIYAQPNKDFIVYDPFMGTGTTAKGCLSYGCSFIGTEISKKQVDYANKRIKNEINKNSWW